MRVEEHMGPSWRAAANFAAIDLDPAGADRARLETQDAISAVGAQTALARQARAVAHELGNLVGVVRGATALIAAGVGDVGLWASRIETAMDGAADLLARLRDEADPAPDLPAVDLRGPAAAALDLARVRLPQVDLRFSLPLAPVVVEAESAAVARVVLDIAFALAAAPGPDPARIDVRLGDDGLVLTRSGGPAGGLRLPEGDLLARAGCQAAHEAAGVRLSWPMAAPQFPEGAA
jgi:hypothetical protein